MKRNNRARHTVVSLQCEEFGAKRERHPRKRNEQAPSLVALLATIDFANNQESVRWATNVQMPLSSAAQSIK
jgi:hypothetical protein